MKISQVDVFIALPTHTLTLCQVFFQDILENKNLRASALAELHSSDIRDRHYTNVSDAGKCHGPSLHTKLSIQASSSKSLLPFEDAGGPSALPVGYGQEATVSSSAPTNPSLTVRPAVLPTAPW